MVLLEFESRWCPHRQTISGGANACLHQLDDRGYGDLDELGDRSIVHHWFCSLDIRAGAEAEEEHIVDEVRVILHGTF